MDLTQIAITQTRSQNQFRFDIHAFEKAAWRRERRLVAVKGIWRIANANILKISENLNFLSNMARRREVS